MSALDFLSPDECGPDVALVSPLRHAVQGSSLIDCSLLGKLEVRGDVEALEAADGEQVLPLGPAACWSSSRALLPRRADDSRPAASASTT